MKKIAVGDVFRIDTPKGKAYFQYVYKDETDVELIRIFPGLFLDEPSNWEEFIKQKEQFLIFFPLAAAYKKKIVLLVENYPIPEGFQKPKYMRTKNVDAQGKFINWHIVDVETLKREQVIELNETQKKLSPWGVWNDTLLVERLTENWTLDKWE